MYNIIALAAGAIPAKATAILGRISVVNATGAGLIQESPNGPPGMGNDLGTGTAVINFPSGSVIPSFGATFVSPLDTSGNIRVRGFVGAGNQVDVIIDVAGFYL
jgi:hypothetical protein